MGLRCSLGVWRVREMNCREKDIFSNYLAHVNTHKHAGGRERDRDTERDGERGRERKGEREREGEERRGEESMRLPGVAHVPTEQ